MLSDVRSRSATSRVVKVKSGMVAIAGGRYLVATGSNRMGSDRPGYPLFGLQRASTAGRINPERLWGLGLPLAVLVPHLWGKCC